jgi:hypothetical protein
MKSRSLLLVGLALVPAFAASPALAGFAGSDLFLPMAGRQAGVYPSNWYTTVWVHNPGTQAATARIYFLERGTSNPSPPFVDVLVAPGDTEKLGNVVETYFHVQKFGALRVTCDTQKLVVTSRVFSKGAGGGDRDSVGQDFAAVPAAFAIGSGESTRLLGVWQSAADNAQSDFRYNFGLVETTGHSATVRFTAYDGNDQQLGSTTVTVQAFSQGQWAYKDRFPSGLTDNARLEAEVISGSGKVIAYGSGIANGSQDPTTFEMQYADALLGGGADSVLSAVEHDATLVGDGTTASPLGLADAAVTLVKLSPAGGASGKVLKHTGAGVSWQDDEAGFSLPVSKSGHDDVNALFTIVNSGGGAAVAAQGHNLAIEGFSNGGEGVYGHSVGGRGVIGSSESSSGVTGSSATGYGVYAYSSLGTALFARGDSAASFKGSVRVDGQLQSWATTSANVAELTNYQQGAGRALYALTDGTTILGHSTRSSSSGKGVAGTATAGSGIYGDSDTGYAGYFAAKVHVNGTLTKSGGSFRIDHPLDPANRTLSHSFVESPEMLNIYDGTVVTDEEGRAVVTLPAWFEALNRDYRYQLTVIGRFAQAIVEREIESNSFAIRTNLGGTKVSWQVTGVRRDPWANANRIPVEEEKPEAERGLYLHPEVYGLDASMGVESLLRESAGGADAPAAAR